MELYLSVGIIERLLTFRLFQRISKIVERISGMLLVRTFARAFFGV